MATMATPKPAIVPAQSSAHTAVTCAAVLSTSTAINCTFLYHALLPTPLVEVVDRYIKMNAWRWSGRLTEIDLPQDMRGRWSNYDRAALRNGESLLVRTQQEEDVRTVSPYPLPLCTLGILSARSHRLSFANASGCPIDSHTHRRSSAMSCQRTIRVG